MIIALAGLSRSGKSTLAEKLKWHYREHNLTCIIISQDDYVKPQNEIPLIKDQIDWEIPESIDFERFKEAIFFFKDKFDVLIIEGIFLFNKPDLLKYWDKIIYLEISKETFLKRKAADTRWGYIPVWFFEHIYESHLKFGVPSTLSENLVSVNSEREVDLEKLFKKIKFIN